MSLAAEIRETYKKSLKNNDIAWNTYVARPIAAILVVILCRTKITPNQVTILGGFFFVTMLIPLLFGKYLGATPLSSLLITALLIEFAYVIDCADGQLARLKKMTSPVGAFFDFLIDEMKAVLLVGAFSIRVWQENHHILWLFTAIFGVAIVSFATSLTAFIRRKEYTGDAEIKPGASANIAQIPSSMVGKIAWLVKRILSFIIHYPSWIWLLPIIEYSIRFLPPDLQTIKIFTPNGTSITASLFFIVLYLAVYILYLAKTGLGIILKLGSTTYYQNKN